MTAEQLLAIGCPSLPDGRFYRLTYEGNGLYGLQIREERKRFGSRRLIERTILSQFKRWTSSAKDDWEWVDWQTAEAAIRDAAERLWDDLEEQTARRTWHQQMNDLLGDHK